MKEITHHLCIISFTAESEGFEPPVQLPVHRISSAAHSTTLAAFQSDYKVTNYLIKRTKKEIKRTIFL